MKFIVSFLVVSVAAGLWAGTVLAPDGRSYREIVVAPDAPSMVKLAARELAEHLELVTGDAIPIVADGRGSGARPVICVGASEAAAGFGADAAGLELEGFRIVSRPEALIILGRDYDGPPIYLEKNPWRALEVWNAELGLNAFGEAGTLYGVYRFLEEVAGIRWYWPGDDGRVVPSADRLEVPEFVLEDAPEYHYRYPWFCLGELDGEQLLWLRRAGFGGQVPVYIMHSYNHMLKYKDSNPEYFALVDGQRDFDNLCCVGGHGHLCLTNPEVVERFVADIRAYFDADPVQRFYPLVPMDGLTRVCGCDACQAEIDYDLPRQGQFSNHIWGFTNKVAIEVAKTHPDKFIGCLSYEQYANPPSRIPELNDNVVVMICYSRAALAGERTRDDVRQRIEQWRTRTSNIYTWNWYLNHWGPWRGLPMGGPEFYADEYRWLAGLGVWKGEFIEAEGQSSRDDMSRLADPGMQHLPLYWSAKLMWHPGFDVNAATLEYYDLFYGPAAEAMREFWESGFTAYAAAGAALTVDSGRVGFVPEDAYDAGRLDAMAQLLDDALAAVPADSVYARRIEVIRSEFLPARQSLVRFSRQGNQQLTVRPIASPTELDQVGVQRFVSRDGGATSEATWFAAGYDRDNLYLKFFCYESQMERLKIDGKGRDAALAWEDDAIEIFISPDPSEPETCFQFIINADGAVWDARHSFGVVGSNSWNAPGVAAAGAREANRWVLTVMIPFRDLELPAGTRPERFLANFYRGHAAAGVELYYTCWSPTFAPANYSPARFGSLSFGE